MKTLIKTLSIIALIVITCLKGTAQVDVTTHSHSSSYYVGWDSDNNLNFRLGTVSSGLPPVQMELFPRLVLSPTTKLS